MLALFVVAGGSAAPLTGSESASVAPSGDREGSVDLANAVEPDDCICCERTQASMKQKQALAHHLEWDTCPAQSHSRTQVGGISGSQAAMIRYCKAEMVCHAALPAPIHALPYFCQRPLF